MQNISNDKNDENDLFILQNKLLFKKFHPIKPIGKGTFSTVYLCINIKNDSYVVIKAEKRSKNGVELLETEAFVLYHLRGFGIPEVLSYGRTKTHNILVLPLLGKNLLDVFILKNKYVNMNDICSTAIQILDRIEWVHSNNIVYRDIKPENFLLGNKDKDIIYLIDFGLCRKYKSSKTGKHIPAKNLGKFTGTSRYASIYAMAGNEQSRRDDIESIGYMIIYFMKKKLPWQGIKGNSYKECYHKLYLMKKHLKIEDLCKGLPTEIIEYMNAARALKFEEEPDYRYLKGLFKMVLSKNDTSFDKYIFSWCKYDTLTDDSTNNKINRRNSNSKMDRKSSAHHRLYKKIQQSIEKKNKSISVPKSYYKQSEVSNKSGLNNPSLNENYNKSKNEVNSIVSNTLKVMVNKNIESGFNKSAGINLNKISYDNSIQNDNFYSYRINSGLKSNLSPDYKRINQFVSISDDKNNKDDSSKLELKKCNTSKERKKIISINSIPTDKKNFVNKNNIISNNKNKLNSINKITQIKMANLNKIELNNKINNYRSINNDNNNKKNENIIYNTYNTYNTYNSYNNTIDKSQSNNINFNSINQKDLGSKDIKNIYNYQNNKRGKNVYQINNNINKKNYSNLFNYINTNSFKEKNANSLSNILPKNKIITEKHFHSIDIRPGGINPHFSYKNYDNKLWKGNDSNNNNRQNKIETKYENIFNSFESGYNEKDKKLVQNNSHVYKNISNLSNNNCQNSNENINNMRLNRKNIFTNNYRQYHTENATGRANSNNKSNNQIHYINNNSLKQIFSINNNLKIDKSDNINPYLKYSQSNINIKSNRTQDNIRKDIYNPFNNKTNNSNSLQKDLINNYNKIVKKPFPVSIYKNKRGSNSVSINKNNINIFNENNLTNNVNDISTNNSKNHNRIIYPGKNENNCNYTKLINNTKSIEIKQEPRILSNHSLKIINNTSKSRKNIQNYSSYNTNDNNKNYYYNINKFKTQETDVNLSEKSKNNGNKVNRINKYKIIRNKGTQNH